MSTTRKGLTSFIAGETIPGGRRVKLSTANTVLLSGSTDEDIGVSTLDISSVTVGKPVPVQLYSEPGFVFITAAGAITVNLTAYKAASGKIAGSGTDVWGVALEAAAADLDIIEAIPSHPAATTPSDGTVTTAKLVDDAVTEAKIDNGFAGSVDGLGALRVARATFNPSATAGQRTVAAHGLGVTIPTLAIVVGGFLQVETALDSADHSGTVAFSVQAANDLITASAISGAPFSTTGQKAIVPKANTPESTGIALTAPRELTATVATTALTVGKATLFVYYVMGA